MPKYIYEYSTWPQFTWGENAINTLLGKVRHMQGKLFGKMSSLGFSLREQSQLTTISMDVLKSSEIEGEKLNHEQVRSSIAKRLGMEYAGMVYASRDVDGVVEMMLNATQKYSEDLTEDRLFGWDSALFPSGRSGMYKIDVGQYRDGPMQVVSGALGKEKVHFEAPPHNIVKSEMDVFLKWFNSD
jgi:Fic family protein